MYISWLRVKDEERRRAAASHSENARPAMVREEICDNVAIARHHQGNTGKPATHNQKHLLTLELSKETGVVKRFTSGKFVLELKILAGSLYSVRATLIISGGTRFVLA